MAFAQNLGRDQSSVALLHSERFTLNFIGMAVIFAALGLGEAVYRLLFLEFDGATDRLPIEILFGIAFAWMTVKLVRRIYQYRLEAFETIHRVRERNHKIRHAVEAITRVPSPGDQQAIRVIREEVDHIDSALTEIIAR
jgi:hypothetical protein